MRRSGRPLAAGVDAGLGLGRHRWRSHPGEVLPRLGPYPLGIATELPGTGVALGHSSSSTVSSASGGASIPSETPSSDAGAPIASTTSLKASKLWPLTSASQCAR